MLTPNLFEVNVRMDKMQQDGTTKAVTESYLVDALSHSEAESRIEEEVGQYVQGACEVTRVARVKISEILDSDCKSDDTFYIVKIGIVVIDEKTMAEKMTACRYVLQSTDDFYKAVTKFKENHVNVSSGL